MVASPIGPIAREIYESKIRQHVEADNHGRYVVIDVISGEYELGDEYLGPIDKLKARLNNPSLFAIRIGFRAVGMMRNAFRIKLIVGQVSP